MLFRSFLKQVATAVGDGAIAGYAAEKYIAESAMFENQIMGETPRIVCVYNAASADDRKVADDMEQYAQCHCGLQLIKADVYKSNGIAQRLNVCQTPCITYIKDNKVLGCVSCGDICTDAIDALIKG